MSEMVHRIVTTRRHFAERPWIFVGLAPGVPLLGYSDLPRAFAEALDFLDVAPEDVLCVHANATVENLQTAEQGSDFGAGPSRVICRCSPSTQMPNSTVSLPTAFPQNEF